MREPRDECRPVTLPSGETLRVRGAEEMTPDAVVALGQLVDAVRKLHAEQHPENPAAVALWERLTAAVDGRGRWLSEVAHEVGVRFSTLMRIAQGYMPDADDLALIESWLEREAAP
jgi:hypothetical protein